MTIGCTLFGLLVLYGVVIGIGKVRGLLIGWSGGWEVYGDGREGVWVRKKGWGIWGRRLMGGMGEERALLGEVR